MKIISRITDYKATRKKRIERVENPTLQSELATKYSNEFDRFVSEFQSNTGEYDGVTTSVSYYVPCNFEKSVVYTYITNHLTHTKLVTSITKYYDSVKQREPDGYTKTKVYMLNRLMNYTPLKNGFKLVFSKDWKDIIHLEASTEEELSKLKSIIYSLPKENK